MVGLFNISGILMGIAGSLLLIYGFLGKGYTTLYSETASPMGYNREAFINSADQKGSAIAGFSILVVGYIEQFISNLPYITSLSVDPVGITLIIIDMVVVCLAFFYRIVVIRFYVGLLGVNWTIPDMNSMPDGFVKDYMKNHGLPLQSRDSTEKIEKIAKRNLKLRFGVIKLGESIISKQKKGTKTEQTKTKKLNVVIFQVMVIIWLLLMIVGSVLQKFYPSTGKFDAWLLVFYTFSAIIFWVFRLTTFFSRNVFLVMAWQIIGSLVVAISVMFLFFSITNGKQVSGIATIITMSIIMVLSSLYFIFANRNEERIVDKVKVSIYISACIFSIALSISNMYSINITEVNQLPFPFKVSPSTLTKVGFSPRNFETYMLTLLTFPFLSLNVILRAVVEMISYNKKNKPDEQEEA